MALTQAMLDQGANTQIEFYLKNDPIDQVNSERPLLKLALGALRSDSLFGNGYIDESVYVTNDSNYQNYYGRQQVTYNEKNPTRLAKFTYANAHEGFFVDEDELFRNGIIITDDKEATLSGAEKIQIVNLLGQKYRAQKASMQEGMDREIHLAGADAESVKGLDHLISTTPTTGIVGGINAATSTYWQNNANMGVTRANVVEEMEEMWKASMLYGGQMPTHILVGVDFLNNYEAVAATKIQRHIAMQSKGGTALDASITGANFHGIPLVWDPTFEKLDAELGAITYPWTRRAYFINSNSVKFRPARGRWMLDRKPPRPFDRYVHYRAMTASYGMTINARNRNAVMSIAAP